jgi:predicted XRE-type DNA-binding protein
VLDDPIPALKNRLARELLTSVAELNHHIAAAVLDIDGARMSDLRRGRHARFSVERLIRLLAMVDRRVDVTVVNTGPAHIRWLHILRMRRDARRNAP